MNSVEYPRKNTGFDAQKTDCETLKVWIEQKDIVLIDVRETHEFEYENIPSSFLLPLSFLDVCAFPALRNNRIVFVCAVGKRSIAALKQVKEIGIKDVFYLDGGLDAWKNAGFLTQGARFEKSDWSI